jgi:membrane dipeptidase
MKLPSMTAVLFLAGAGAASAQMSAADIEREARAIHDRVIALDTHVDIADGYATGALDPGGFSTAQVDLPKMRAGGLDAVFLIVYTPQGAVTPEGFAEARRIANSKIEAIHRLAGAYPDDIAIAYSASDAGKIAKSGRRVAFIGMENAFPLGADLVDVDKWRARGVRYMGITHFGHNQFGDSSNPNTEGGDPDEKFGGLSPLGRDLVAALNRAGIMVDVSHAGRKTMMQALEASAAPIIASHSGVKAIADSPRNLDDEQLRAIAANGGVAQLVALDTYVKPLTAEQETLRGRIRKEMGIESAAARAAMSPEKDAEYSERLKALWEIAPRATLSDFVDHIDYAVKIAGIDHVGIASDFDGGGGVDGWDDASETFNVTRELVRRGYSEEEIAKIWSGNLLRVLKDVEKAAKELQKAR